MKKKTQQKVKKSNKKQHLTEPVDQPTKKVDDPKAAKKAKKKQRKLERCRRRLLNRDGIADHVIFYAGRGFVAVLKFFLWNLPSVYYLTITNNTVLIPNLNARALWETQEQLQLLAVVAGIMTVISVLAVLKQNWSYKKYAKQRDAKLEEELKQS